MKNILIIEDDIDFAEIVRDMLEGYGYQVSIVNTCEAAYEILKTNQFHLILMDINLPDGTGFEVCKELRSVSSVPVIFASARTGEDDKITGLDIGGDDYLAKPYSLKELLARVNALIRRTYGSESEERVYQIHTIRVDVANRTVQKNGAEIKLALKEFDLLAYLCAHPNKAIRKEELLREVWGIFSEAEIATVAVHIRWLREKLENDPSNPTLIRTVWGVGYEFCTDKT
ncbi:MAG: response regulator transcription factor [Acetatifactor sp.]|nr:response regulator transcription factor [Acetatifactor sp.]